MMGIYKITSPIGCVYIGKSVNIEKRWQQYRAGYSKGQPKLHASFLTFGVDSHKFEVITECVFHDLHNNESYYISLHKIYVSLNCVNVNHSEKVRVQKPKPKDWKEYIKHQLLKNPLPIDLKKKKLENAAKRRALQRKKW